MSAKHDKKRYIGNKGLGFRSIVNWADSDKEYTVMICYLRSVRKLSKKSTRRRFPGRTGLDFNKEYGLKYYEIPIPLLSLPKVEVKENDSEYATTIHINYKREFYGDIIKQVKQLRPVYPSLHHIEEIQFQGFDNRKDIKMCKRVIRT
ncbi:MAG: hypothetical protein U5K71_15720 [Gracilimonas sp.]|nr:hypothetical protein [Gracilimonas sp.]